MRSRACNRCLINVCLLLSRAYELNEFIAHTVRVAGALLQGKERHIFAEVQLIAHVVLYTYGRHSIRKSISDTTSSSVRIEKNWIVRLTRSHPPECKMGPCSIHRIGKSSLSEIQTQAHPLCVFRSVRQVGVDRIQAEETQRSRINAESNRCQGAVHLLC